ncbi:replication factor RFC1 C terminal domain-containing protein [Coemansia spiralis]|nr:replication factor RFC1 C terminal domain-containing protein [Coemansia spiralis]
MSVDTADAMDVDEPKEIGFPASELPDVAPKKFSYAQHMQHMGGAKHPGSKSTPEGAPNCLADLRFVVTGEFSSLSREEITDLIKVYGGHLTSAVSGKTSFLVVGGDPGSSKVKKAKSLKTRCLYEDDLFELIRSSKDSSSSSALSQEGPHEELQELEGAEPLSQMDVSQDQQEPLHDSKGKAKEKAEAKVEHHATPKKRHQEVASKASNVAPHLSASQPDAASSPSSAAATDPSELWTEKYKPKKLSELCGHKGNAELILHWLSQWATGLIPDRRAILISGPPGIGKTTTAHLVSKLAGFDVLELNASETRSKSTLKDILGSAVGNRGVLEFDRKKIRNLEATQEQQLKNDGDLQRSLTTSGAKKLVVIMDEVDGMSGGDRGGSTELIQLVKRTRVPIICICNDRQSTKVRSLANYCEDMKFRRPTEQQMRARLNTIAFREGLKLEPNAVAQLVQSTHNDIRQIINLLSSYSLNKSSMSYMDSKAFSTLNKKEVSVGPFDVIGKYLNGAENMGMSFADKLDLYYNDFSIIPLFVQENYIDNRPARADSELGFLDSLSNAADLISEADLVDNKLRGTQQWGLMPLHAALSCVGPAQYMRGGHNGMYRFPGWLGQNSKGNKLGRMLREVQSHMRLRVSADKTEIRKSYIPSMVPELVTPLVSQGAGGIPDVISMMDHYYLNKEHWDAMLELHLDGDKLLKMVPTAVKTAFTREYNKGNHPIAYQTLSGVASGKAVSDAASAASLKPDTEDYVDLDEAEEAEEDSATTSDIEDDALAKPVKRKAGNRAGAKASGSGVSMSKAAAPRKRRKP